MSWKDKESLVLAHAYNPSAEAELKCKAPGLYSKKTNNSASSGESSAPLTEPPHPMVIKAYERKKSNRSTLKAAM